VIQLNQKWGILSNALVCFFLLVSLQKEDKAGTPTGSAHPARFSPDDKFSRERIMGKKRFNLLPTQVRCLAFTAFRCP
jgi:H/ACA ribonucleoprotein complex subunit 3